MNPHEDHTSEQRHSYRCPIAPGHQNAELRFRRQRVSVRLYNESAGGFAAWLEHDPGLKLDDVVELLTDSESCDVRVAHAAWLEPKAGSVENCPRFRLGLERMEYRAEPRRQQSQARLTPSCAGRRLLSTNLSMAARCALIGLMIAIASATVLAILIRSNHPLARSVNDWQGPPSTATLTPEKSSPSQDTFVETAAELGLSEAEQKQARAGSISMARALEGVGSRWRHADAQERSRKQTMLWEALRKDILDTLTEEERARWADVIQ